MNDDTTSIILIFLIFTFLIWMIQDKLKNKKWFIEAMGGGVHKKIILMGDGFLNNHNYVEPPDDIKTIMTKQKALVVAYKKSTIKDLESQLLSIPEKHNHAGTILFISAGGMDLKNHYRYGSEMDLTKFNEILNEYKNVVKKIKKKLNHVQIVLCDLSSVKLKGSENMFNRWNKQIYQFAKDHQFRVMKISELFRNEDYIVKNLDPSKKGGYKIVSAIENGKHKIPL
jgi:hypothetical protein